MVPSLVPHQGQLMKYSLLLALLFSVSSAGLFSSDTVSEPADMKTVEVPASTVNVTAVCPDNSCKKMDEMNSKIDSMDNEIKKIKSAEVVSDDMVPEPVLAAGKKLIIGVVGQGVAPMNTTSPAQAYALAKRAAVADAYRMIAEKVKGVRIDGQDLIKNMMVQRSTIRTSVDAMVRNANIVETTFKEGLCEVEMEIELSHSQFAQ